MIIIDSPEAKEEPGTTYRPEVSEFEKAPSSTSPRLLDQVREKIRLRHYSIRTEQSYVDWIKRFILFHGKRHPKEMGAPEVEQFLTYLAVERNVAASTQNQALSATLYLYKEVLEIELPWLTEVRRAKKSERMPVGRKSGSDSLMWGIGLDSVSLRL